MEYCNTLKFSPFEIELKLSNYTFFLYKAIETPKQGDTLLFDSNKYHALYIIRNHMHLDLKGEYLMEEDSCAL